MIKKTSKTVMLTFLLILMTSSLVLANSWSRNTTYGKVTASHSSYNGAYGYASKIQTSALYQRGNGTITVKTKTVAALPALIEQGGYAYANSINGYGVSTAKHYGPLVEHFHD